MQATLASVWTCYDRRMSYTAVNNMRSARYPLEGLGCGCSAPASVGSFGGLGQAATTNWMPWAIGGVALLGLGVGSYFALRPVRRNRRRRHR